MDKKTKSSKEFLLLLDLLSKYIFSGQGTEIISAMDAETLELVCAEADENRLGALLYFYCGKDKILPDLWQDKWSAEFISKSAEELRQATELKSIFKLLSDNNIESAPLKGVCMAYNYYPHPALRSMSDFDILICPENIKKAFQLLINNGFSSGYDFKISHHEPQLSSPRGFVVELHSHIGPDLVLCEYDALWKDCQKIDFKGQNIINLSPEITLLHAVNHAFRDKLIGGLKGFIDVAYIFAAANININRLEDCARKNGFYDELTLFMNIFPSFFPKEYHLSPVEINDNLLESARYLIYNSNYAQAVDKHQLMLYREYGELSFFNKLFFMKKKMNVKAVSVAKIYNCRPHSPMLIYYYFRRAYEYFKKLVLFEKKSKHNNLTKNIGVYQKKIQNYLNIKAEKE
jgi:Uncharacterised nucleotidyltransferase